MASTNQSPFYRKAEARFLSAQTDEQRLEALEEMIRECPKHKSSEKMLAQLKTRYKKLKTKLEKEKTSKKSLKKKKGIKKEEMQAVIIGFTNTGKSSLLSILTNVNPEIADYDFTTKNSLVGMMNYHETQIQIIEIPAIESEFYDKGTVNTADTILILITNLEQLKEIEKTFELFTNAGGTKKIIVFNKSDLLSDKEKRKISATLQSKKYNFILISTKTQEGIEKLKDKIFQSFGKIRVYTKEPGKSIDVRKERPIILSQNSNVKDIAEKIFHGESFIKQIKETKIWGPSSKFPGQTIGLSHKLKDLDVIEFKTR